MSPELANQYSWLQVASVPLSLAVYQKSKVYPELMYIQHRHMVCGKSHIYHDLFLDQNINDNSYSTPFLHEAFDVYQKMLILGIVCYHNTFSHFCVQHQHYPEHYTLYLSILISYIYLINDSMFTMLYRHIFLKFFR